MAAGFAAGRSSVPAPARDPQPHRPDRVGRLAEANELLSSLHHVAQDLPTSLDLVQVVDSTAAQLRSFWELSALAILVPDETSDRWLTLRQEGVGLPLLLATEDLPPPLRRAARSDAVVTFATGTGGLLVTSRSGLYAALRAGGRLVGLVAVEQERPDAFGADDVRLLGGVTETAGLALDNARSFERLRTVGADAERTRIAGELHDRVGQSLASIGFELDRLSRHSPDEDLRPGIDRVRANLREAMGEIRDTLYDLRTDVSEDRALGDVLDSFLARVHGRTGTEVHLERGDDTVRLPLPQERELWRIAQEAVTNAQRHGAAEVTVRWHADGVRAELEVSDDGPGFDITATGPAAGGYGLAGMRQRAASIGASLDVRSDPGRGTRIRCRLGPP